MRVQDPLSRIGVDVWYVYRDGHFDLQPLLKKGGRCLAEAIIAPFRIGNLVAGRDGRPSIVLADKRAVDMTGTDPEFRHYRRVGRL